MSISSISDVYLRYITSITTNIARIRRGAGRWVADKYHNAYRGRRTYHECICNISAESIMGSCITDENVYHSVSRRITYVSYVTVSRVSYCVSYRYRHVSACITSDVSRLVSQGPGETGEGLAIRSNVSADVRSRIMEISDVCITRLVYQCISEYHAKNLCIIMIHAIYA